MLYNLVIAPIETVVEWVFLFFSRHFQNQIIIAICGVSIVINFLALPLYNIADSLQEKERRIAKKLEPRLKRIKKAFKGDEQFMMTQAYYRENNYSPIYVLRSSLSILIEIPFFIAAYHFLSNCSDLADKSFWIFKNLGAADNLFSITIAGHLFAINILPILMTAINFVSGAIYTKNATSREKVQLYVVALIFLVLLYNSPSGLVIYWILNNTFSLVKNVVVKTKNPKRIVHIFLSVCLALFSAFFIYKRPNMLLWKKLFLTFVCVCFILAPLAFKFFKKTKLFNFVKSILYDDKTLDAKEKKLHDATGFSIFIFSAIGLALLLGFVLPASVIASSPIEFSFLGNTASPVAYIFSCFCVYAGFCVFWPLVIYKMFGKKTQKLMSIIFFVLLITVLFNVYVFKPNYGNMNAFFVLENSEALNNRTLSNTFLPLFVMLFSFIAILLAKKFQKGTFVSVLLFALCISEIAFASYKTHFCKTEYLRYASTRTEGVKTTSSIKSVYHLSKTKPNVMVIFLDRAISSFFPYIIEQYPELNDEFSGFTYYPNCLSFGFQTNTGAPGLLGGYEYTPIEINKRKTELLVNKHHEATFVMPRLFEDIGFDVTITDSPWLNYDWQTGNGPEIAKNFTLDARVLNVNGKYTDAFIDETFGKDVYKELHKADDIICKNGVVNFAAMQAILPIFRRFFYFVVKYEKNNSKINPYAKNSFIDSYSTLHYLPLLTDFDNSKGTYTFIECDVVHSSNDYSDTIAKWGEVEKEKNYGSYKPRNEADEVQYKVNVKSYTTLAKYFNYLKENNVYDNTRIILVSDHGFVADFEVFDSFKDNTLPSCCNPILFVKDFNAKGKIKTDKSFMTNADTLFFAKENLPVSDKNPFTKKLFTQEKQNGVTIVDCHSWNATDQKNWTQFDFDPKKGWHVSDNIFDPKNWIPLEKSESLVKD